MSSHLTRKGRRINGKNRIALSSICLLIVFLSLCLLFRTIQQVFTRAFSDSVDNRQRSAYWIIGGGKVTTYISCLIDTLYCLEWNNIKWLAYDFSHFCLTYTSLFWKLRLTNFLLSCETRISFLCLKQEKICDRIRNKIKADGRKLVTFIILPA